MDEQERVALREAQSIVDQAGVHRRVRATVDRVEHTDAAVTLWVTLDYRADSPVCCGMPECYTPFLRPDGLREIADEYRVARKLLLAPRVTIVATPVFEPGFQFIESELWKPISRSITYATGGPGAPG